MKKISAGQSMIEFALVLPIFFLLMMGLFDIGRAVFYFATLNSAVREGTRLAIVQPDCDYRSDPANCDGGYLESYPLNCTDAVSTANTKICDDIVNKFFTVGTLQLSTILIDHTVSSTNDPEINISIDYLFEPITPGIALLGDLTLHVNSHMLMTPIAEP
jgi:hypothetical protein